MPTNNDVKPKDIVFARVSVAFGENDNAFRNMVSDVIDYRSKRLKAIIAMMEENVVIMCQNKFKTEEEKTNNLKVTAHLLEQIASIIRNNIEDSNVIIHKLKIDESSTDKNYIY